MEASARFLLSWTALLACTACSLQADRPPSTSSLEPAPSGFVFSAEDAARLEARIDRDPAEAILYLEKVVASSIASLSDEQFERLRAKLIELLDEGRLQRLVRAGREAPATSHGVARLLDDLEAWDDSIQRGIDVPDPGYYDR